MTQRGLLLCLIAGLAAVSAPPSAMASTSTTWCWSMQGGALKGTFTTSGTTPGDGTAPAGTYNLTDASVYESSFPDIEVGSISDGTYAFGTQPQYQIIWNGTGPMGFYRGSGTYTNGFGMYNGASGSGAYLIFAIDYQSADTTDLVGSTRIFFSGTTPALFPAYAGGACESGSGSTPVDVLEQYGRATNLEVCRETYGPSWAMWMNQGTGGWVCTRTLTYSRSSGRWIIAS